MNKEQIKKSHFYLFNVKPEIIILSPSRINIIGEHIDYLGGNVLPANIDLYMLGSFSKNENFKVFSENYKNLGIKEVKNEKSFTFDESNGFMNFVLGCVQILRKNNFNIVGAYISIYSNVPSSSGLSSSASLGILIIKGLLTLYGYNEDGITIAKLFKEVENNFMNLKNGIMDQFIIANGKANNLMLLNTSTLKFSNHEINLGDYQFVVFNTKKKRELIDSKYNERVNETSLGLKKLNEYYNYNFLTEIPIQKLDENLGKIENKIIKKRVKYVVEEQNRVENFVKLLNTKNFKAMGEILNKGHQGLKNLYEVSCSELDFIVENSIKINGVLGARMTGAGFGGCAIVLTHKDSIKELKKEIINKYKDKFGFECEMYIVKVVDGATDIT